MTDETGMTDDKRLREILAEEYERRGALTPEIIASIRDGSNTSPGVSAALSALSRASVSLPVTEDKMREALESIIQSDPARANEVIKTDEHWEIVMGWLEKAAALTPASPQSANAQTEGK